MQRMLFQELETDQDEDASESRVSEVMEARSGRDRSLLIICEKIYSRHLKKMRLAGTTVHAQGHGQKVSEQPISLCAPMSWLGSQLSYFCKWPPAN